MKIRNLAMVVAIIVGKQMIVQYVKSLVVIIVENCGDIMVFQFMFVLKNVQANNQNLI